MRLAVFTNRFPTRVATFFARDMRALRDAGVELDVFPFYPCDDDLWRFVPAALDEHVLPRRRVHHLDLWQALRTTRLPAHRTLGQFARGALPLELAALRYGPGPAAKTAYVALKAWLWAQREKGQAYDHVLAYWGNYAASCAYLFHRLVVPHVPFSMLVHARMDLYRVPAYLAEKMLYADNVFLVCEYNRRYLSQHYADVFPQLAPRLRIHHLGLDLAEYRYEPEHRVPGRIVFAGRLEELKGVHVLLEAVARVRAAGRGVELEIVGGGPAERALRALAARLAVADIVHFRGWQPPDVVRRAMRDATILAHVPVQPDAMPTVLKEAIALGTPVVASRLAGIPEILDDGRCGVLTPPGDVGAVADALMALLDDSPRRARLAAAGRRHAEALFDVRQTGPRLTATLRSTPPRSLPA